MRDPGRSLEPPDSFYLHRADVDGRAQHQPVFAQPEDSRQPQGVPRRSCARICCGFESHAEAQQAMVQARDWTA